MPMKPMTTEGMAASSSMPAFSGSFRRRGAISAMYRAAAMPMGTEMAAAPRVTSSEPRISGRMPKRGGLGDGVPALAEKEINYAFAAEEGEALAQQEQENEDDEDNRENPAEQDGLLDDPFFQLAQPDGLHSLLLAVHRHEIDPGHDLLAFGTEDEIKEIWPPSPAAGRG